MDDVTPERLQQALFDNLGNTGPVPRYRVTIEPTKLSPYAELWRGEAYKLGYADPPTLREMLTVLATEYPNANLECDPALLDHKINSVRVVEPNAKPLDDGMVSWTMGGLVSRP